MFKLTGRKVNIVDTLTSQKIKYLIFTMEHIDCLFYRYLKFLKIPILLDIESQFFFLFQALKYFLLLSRVLYSVLLHSKTKLTFNHH